MVNIPEATKMLEAIHQLGQMPMDSNSLIRDNRINIFHQWIISNGKVLHRFLMLKLLS